MDPADLPRHLEVRIWASECPRGRLLLMGNTTIIAPSHPPPPCPFLHRLIHILNSAGRFTFQQEAPTPTAVWLEPSLLHQTLIQWKAGSQKVPWDLSGALTPGPPLTTLNTPTQSPPLALKPF